MTNDKSIRVAELESHVEKLKAVLRDCALAVDVLSTMLRTANLRMGYEASVTLGGKIITALNDKP